MVYPHRTCRALLFRCCLGTTAQQGYSSVMLGGSWRVLPLSQHNPVSLRLPVPYPAAVSHSMPLPLTPVTWGSQALFKTNSHWRASWWLLKPALRHLDHFLSYLKLIKHFPMFHDKGSAAVYLEKFPGHRRHKKCVCNQWNHQTSAVDRGKCLCLSLLPAKGAWQAQRRAVTHLTKHDACNKQVASGKALSFSGGVEVVWGRWPVAIP